MSNDFIYLTKSGSHSFDARPSRSCDLHQSGSSGPWYTWAGRGCCREGTSSSVNLWSPQLAELVMFTVWRVAVSR